MSEVQRMLLSKAGLPPKAPFAVPSSSSATTSSMPAPPPRPPRLPKAAPSDSKDASSAPPSSGVANAGCTVVDQPGEEEMAPWLPYFDQRRLVPLAKESSESQPEMSGEGEDVFAVYTAGDPNLPGPVIVLLHGGGLCSLSYALAVAQLKAQCRVLAFDFRGHGATRTVDDSDLSSSRLVEDCHRVLEASFGGRHAIPPIMLVGHSLGGAVAIHVAARRQLPITGLVVIDVVEGTAMDSLKHMNAFLDARPCAFPSLERAVEWAVGKGGVRNVDSARVSVPGQLRKVTSESGGVKFQWRTDLRATEPFWKGWFEGMSAEFVALPPTVTKLLLLAGTDRLDKELMIAQMQGKFQLGVVYGTGHMMMEDKPAEVASRLAEFHRRLIAVSNFHVRPPPK
eukprot:RCo019991